MKLIFHTIICLHVSLFLVIGSEEYLRFMFNLKQFRYFENFILHYKQSNENNENNLKKINN